MGKRIRIATRKSPLALWQAEHVKRVLMEKHPDLSVELIPMSTQGDKILDTPLAKIGGKGLFVKELEQRMLENKADIAVHSMKDVPVNLPEGLHLPVILEREVPNDAFVSNTYSSFAELPQNAIIGTSSLRRQSQLRHLRPDIQIKDLRGNVGTRLGKLDDGQFDAIILAAAGLIRLGLSKRITQALDTQTSLPAIGQGAIGIECRIDDAQTLELISVLDHSHSHICVTAERGFNHRLDGGCQVPIAGHATLDGDQLNMDGLVGEIDGSILIREQTSGAATNAEQIGIRLANSLLARGAGDILERIYATNQ